MSEELEVIRVSGHVTCPHCQKAYQDHPWDEVNVSFIDGLPFLRLGCDGRRLKL